jgi:hypothetical protein
VAHQQRTLEIEWNFRNELVTEFLSAINDDAKLIAVAVRSGQELLLRQ